MPLAADIVDTFDLTRQKPSIIDFHTAPIQLFEPDPDQYGSSRPKLTKDGVPQYKDVDYVTIRQPGGVDSVIFECDIWLKRIIPSELDAKRMHPQHAQFYKQAYQRFKDGQEAPVDGTSVKMWPVATPAQVAMLLANNVRTVEQMADLPDDGLRRLGMGGVDLKIKAKAWLSAANDKGKLSEEMVAVQKKNALLEANLATLMEKVNQLSKEKSIDVEEVVIEETKQRKK